MPKITPTFLNSLRPTERNQFFRDTSLQGFGVKLSPRGRISFIAEARIRGGRTRRKTFGTFPATSIQDAKEKAQGFLRLAQAGVDPVQAQKREAAKQQALSQTVQSVFDDYMEARPLAPKTDRDYKSTFRLVFESWSKLPIRDITRKDAEKIFIATQRDRGTATALKAVRMLRAVFNFAMADEVDGERIITENPFDVIKQKKLTKPLQPRETYLDEQDIDRLITFFHDQVDWGAKSTNGVTPQGINFVMLLLSTGLRRSEGTGLRWEDVNWSRKTFTARDTKNGTDHHAPMSTLTEWILKKQQAVAGDSEWVFPANSASGHMEEPKSQIKKITKATGVKFKPHDLRRTFATHAANNGVSYEMIREALNHKSGGGVTRQYIIKSVDTLRPVFEAVSDGYHTAYNPDWKTDLLIDEAERATPH